MGGSVSLAATDLNNASYTWSDGASANLGTDRILLVSPAVTTTYSVAVVNPLTGCTSSASRTIVVLSAPSVNAGNDLAVCEGGANVSLTGSPAGGTWAGNGVSGSGGAYSFSAASAGVGTFTLAYTYTQLGVGYSDDLVLS